MHITDAQRDVRTTFRGGFAGQLVAGLLWLASAALATWHTARSAIIALAVGGMLIFPLAQLVLRLMGGTGRLPRGHPMNQLAMQEAFTLPLSLPLVGAATLHRLDWFYPAFMIALGAHYLPFTFLYGMWQFTLLAGALIAGGVVLGLYLPLAFSAGAWFTGTVLLLFAIASLPVGRSNLAARSTD